MMQAGTVRLRITEVAAVGIALKQSQSRDRVGGVVLQLHGNAEALAVAQARSPARSLMTTTLCCKLHASNKRAPALVLAPHKPLN